MPPKRNGLSQALAKRRSLRSVSLSGTMDDAVTSLLGRTKPTAINATPRTIIVAQPVSVDDAPPARMKLSTRRGAARTNASAGRTIVQLRKTLRRYIATMVQMSTEKSDDFGARYELYSRRWRIGWTSGSFGSTAWRERSFATPVAPSRCRRVHDESHEPM